MKYLLLMALATVLVFGGCGDDSQSAGCVEGEVQLCPCGGGLPDGTQTCQADGTWTECDCGSGDMDTDTDTDSDSDTDTDTDTDTDAECASGVCCDTSTGTFRPPTYPCNVTTTYACTNTDCGADAQEQDTTQYCSGTSELCNGNTEPDGWTVAENCGTDAICEYNTTDSWCTNCPFGCTAGGCDSCLPVWTEHAVEDYFSFISSVFAADVDGDGDIDVLGTCTSADDITWWENTSGDGTIWAEHTLDGAFEDAYSVYAADVDGDGDIDVLGAAMTDDDITWWENTAGDGTAWTEHAVDGAFDGAMSVYAADVDGDGDMDVLGAAMNDDCITWWENTNGSGTVWTEHLVNGSFNAAKDVFAIDVDGDGDMDVLGARWSAIAWWENTTGNGTVWIEHSVDNSIAEASSVFAADVDGDGDIDVLGTDLTDDEITWWENTAGDGTSWSEHIIDGAFNMAMEVYAADVDGDGDVDVLGAAWIDDSITWWENAMGDGTVWNERTVDGVFDGARAVFAKDMDGDGDVDVLGGSSNDNDITWWESDCIP